MKRERASERATERFERALLRPKIQWISPMYYEGPTYAACSMHRDVLQSRGGQAKPRPRDRSSSLVGTRMHASGSSITRYNGDSRNGDCNDEDGGDDVDEIKSHHKWLCLLATMMLKWRRRRLRPSLAEIPIKGMVNTRNTLLL